MNNPLPDNPMGDQPPVPPLPSGSGPATTPEGVAQLVPEPTTNAPAQVEPATPDIGMSVPSEPVKSSAQVASKPKVPTTSRKVTPEIVPDSRKTTAKKSFETTSEPKPDSKLADGLIIASLAVSGLTLLLVFFSWLLLGRGLANQAEKLDQLESLSKNALTREQSSAFLSKADLPQLAKNADVTSIQTDLQRLRQLQSNQATKAEVSELAKGKAIEELSTGLAELARKLPQPMPPTPNKSDEVLKKLNELEQAIKAKPVTVPVAPPTASPDPTQPVDVVILFCHSQNKLNASAVATSLNEAVQLVPDAPSRIGVYVASAEEVVAERKLASRLDGRNTLAEDLGRLAPPKGLERPGPVLFNLVKEFNQPRRAVILIATPGAEVPDLARWRSFSPRIMPYVILVQRPDSLLETSSLQSWLDLCREGDGTLSFVKLSSVDAAGYKQLDRSLSRQFQAIFADIRRNSK